MLEIRELTVAYGGVVALDQVEKMRRNRERELSAGKQDAATLFIR